MESRCLLNAAKPIKALNKLTRLRIPYRDDGHDHVVQGVAQVADAALLIYGRFIAALKIAGMLEPSLLLTYYSLTFVQQLRDEPLTFYWLQLTAALIKKKKHSVFKSREP